MKTIQHICSVISNRKVCPCFYHLTFAAPGLAAKVRPGQFIHIRITAGMKPFFRRPFSVFRARNKKIEILYEVVGPGTELLSQKKKGASLDILGPLGNSFSLPGRNVRQVVMIAGGIGIAPFLILSDRLKTKRVQMTLLYGARSAGHVFSFKAFRQNGCRVHIATDDGSRGRQGLVSVLYPQMDPDPATTMIYTCGPRAMMADVQRVTARWGLSAQASCEEVMACGLGACLGCVIKTTRGYRTVCNDGPIFDLREVIF